MECYEYENESSVSIKSMEILDKLRHYELLKDSVPRKWVI